MIRRLIIGALIVFIALATVLTVLLGTEPGTRWLIKTGAGFSPGTLEIRQVEGTFLRGLRLARITFEDDTVTARLARLEVRVNAAALFAGRLAVTRLNADGLDLHIRPDPEPGPSEPLRIPESIILPLAIDLSPARFSDLSVTIGDAPPVRIHEIRLAGSVDRKAAHIRTLMVDAPDFSLDLTARAELTMPYAASAELQWRAHLPEPVAGGLGAGEAHGRIALDGTLERLGIRHRVEAPVRITGEGELRDLPGTPAWDLEHRWEAFTWRQPGYGAVELAAGELHSEGTPAEFTVTLGTAVTLPDLPSQRIRLTGRGSTESFTELALEVDGDTGRLALDGSAGWLPNPVWDVAVQGRDLDPGAVNPEFPGRLNLDARVTGSLDEAGTPDVLVDKLELTGTLLDQELRITGSARISDTDMTTPGLVLTVNGGTLNVTGRAGWQPQPNWDLRIEGEDLDPGPWAPDWPGRLALALESSGRLEADNAVHGELRLERLEGRIADHAISIQGDAQLLGHGFSTPDLRVAVDEARLAISGEAAWAPVPRWDLRVEADNLDPGLINPELAGRLAIRGRSEGRLDPEHGVDAHIELDRLEGTLRDYPVSAQGSARLEEGRRVTTPGFEVHLGENRLDLRGSAERDSAQLHYRIDAPALDALWPGLRGTLLGDGRLAGDWRQPDLDLRLEGAGLGFEGWSLDSLALEAEGALQPDMPLALTLDAAGLARDEQVLARTVRLEAWGHAQAHGLSLHMRTDEGDLGLRLEGRMTDTPGWSGRIASLDLTGTRLGDWRLAAPARLDADPRQGRLAPLCLTRDAARLCLEGDRHAAEGLSALLDLSDLRLEWLAEWLPENVAVDGSLSAAARLRHDDAGLTVESRAGIDSGELHVLGLDGERQTLPFRDVSLEAELDRGVMDARATLSFLERGRADAELRVTPEGDTHRLSGRARADLQELRWLEVAAPQLRDLEGRLNADLRLSGTLESPEFQGEMRLTEGRALIPELGLELTDLHLRADAEGLDRLTLEGGVRSGPGELELAGEAGVTPEGTPWAELTLRGERFQAVHRPEAQVLISPDLAMELAARDIRLTGRLTIPEARIELRELPPQAVSVSRDEVIVDAAAVEPPWHVRTSVTVTLGEQVHLSGFGLTGRLAGEVAVEDSPARPVRVEGEIRIEDGRYRAYGQNLTVERGVLVFQGPADNPGLDIRAVRRVPVHNVSAGLAIGGTLQDPRSRVFSTPAMEDSEAMSYLLTGRPLSGASEADANVLAAAIAAFGVEQGGMLTAQIGRAVGLDEFILDAEGDMDQSALMMGKHLSSRLYLRYTVGLFERASSLMLRYSLSRTLSLETRTSDEAQSMDLIYRLER